MVVHAHVDYQFLPYRFNRICRCSSRQSTIYFFRVVRRRSYCQCYVRFLVFLVPKYCGWIFFVSSSNSRCSDTNHLFINTEKPSRKNFRWMFDVVFIMVDLLDFSDRVDYEGYGYKSPFLLVGESEIMILLVDCLENIVNSTF